MGNCQGKNAGSLLEFALEEYSFSMPVGRIEYLFMGPMTFEEYLDANGGENLAGYRVKSPQGRKFRQWATKRIHEYIVKGFTMDDERLKQEGARSRYFEELMPRNHI